MQFYVLQILENGESLKVCDALLFSMESSTTSLRVCGICSVQTLLSEMSSNIYSTFVNKASSSSCGPLTYKLIGDLRLDSASASPEYVSFWALEPKIII